MQSSNPNCQRERLTNEYHHNQHIKARKLHGYITFTYVQPPKSASKAERRVLTNCGVSSGGFYSMIPRHVLQMDTERFGAHRSMLQAAEQQVDEKMHTQQVRTDKQARCRRLSQDAHCGRGAAVHEPAGDQTPHSNTKRH